MKFSQVEIRIMVRNVTQYADEDLEQEATLRAMQAFRTRIDVRHPQALLRKIVHDTVVDHWRRRRSHDDLDSINEARLATPCTVEQDMDRRRQCDALRQAMSVLDAGKRATLDLFYSEGRAVREIAHLQNRSQSAVKMDLLRSRRELSRIVVSLLKKKSR
jgi:RNA polymerase sigma-70 factor, ECF subfamily